LAKSIERSCAVAGEIRVLGMRRAFTVVAAVLALASAAQPAGAKDDPKLRTMAEIGAALEAHGITPCDTPDWTKKSYGRADDEPTAKAESVVRTHVVVAGRPCPDRAAYADELAWEDAADGSLTYGVYKSKSSKAYRKQLKYPLIFAYKRALILEPSEDVLQEPFLAAMADLGARRGSER
jgi:hypothetical protein